MNDNSSLSSTKIDYHINATPTTSSSSSYISILVQEALNCWKEGIEYAPFHWTMAEIAGNI
jgi:hypothetical protein